jgi:flagellar motor switch protein FliG
MKAAPNNAEAGIRKAAILVASLDQFAADVLLDQLSPERAQLVREAVMNLDEIDDREQQRVIEEFRRIGPMLPGQSPAGIELDGPLVQQFASAACSVEDEPEDQATGSKRPFDFLRDAEEEKLAQLLCSERPPTIALVLSHLEAGRAGDVLARFAPTQQVEVVRRLVDLDNTDPEVLREVARTLETRFSRQFAIEPTRAAGPDIVARILAACDAQVAGRLLDNLAAHDGPLAKQLGCRPVQFDDLAEFDDAELLAAFRAAEPQVVQAALLGAAPDLVARLLRGMAPEEAKMLRSSLDHPGPFCLRDIEEARRQMAASAQRSSTGRPRRPALAA